MEGKILIFTVLKISVALLLLNQQNQRQKCRSIKFSFHLLNSFSNSTYKIKDSFVMTSFLTITLYSHENIVFNLKY